MQNQLSTPKTTIELFHKGNSLDSLGKYNEAIKCLDEAIKLNPKDEKVWFNKGNSLNSLGKYNEAIKCLDEAIKIKS